MTEPLLGQGYDERVPLVLVLDTSESMARPEKAPRITALNNALSQWLREASQQPSLRSRIEVAIITFGSAVRVLSPATGQDGPTDPAVAFAPIGDAVSPQLTTDGYTLMVPAITSALKLAVSRRRLLDELGVPSRCPQIWLLTDGAASDADGTALGADSLAAAAQLIRAAERSPEQAERCLFYAIGVGAADLEKLRILAPDSTMKLDSIDYRDIFKVVTASSESVRSSDTAADAYQQAKKHAEFAEKWRQLNEQQR